MTTSRQPIHRHALAPVAGLLAASLLAAGVLHTALGPSLPTASEAPAAAAPAVPASIEREAADLRVRDAQRRHRGQPEPYGIEAPPL